MSTGASASLTASGAVVAGTLDPNGRSTTYHFEYGTSTSYGTSTTGVGAGSATSWVSVQASLGGLQAGTTYHYRLVASSSAGTSRGTDASFTTPGASSDSASTSTSSVSTTTAPTSTATTPTSTSTSPTSTSTSTTSTTSTPAQSPQAAWTAPGTPPQTDAQAAALVTHQPETRTDNIAANAYVPSDAQLQAFRSAKTQYGQTEVQYNPLTQYVTGRPGLSAPSTDDLIQWAAHKWGVPEDVMRAQMVVESYWHQNALGDRATVSSSWFSLYPVIAQVLGTTDVYESMSIAQIKWKPDGSASPGTEPLRWESTAFALDFYGASIRYYYDGLCSWCTTGYAAGQSWNSVGAWYQPYPWNNADQQAYIVKVQNALAGRVWTQSGFAK